MAKYREIGPVVEARQWFPSKDANDDARIRAHRHVGYDLDTLEERIGFSFTFDDGIAEVTLRPGDWIVETEVFGTRIERDDTFHQRYYRLLDREGAVG